VQVRKADLAYIGMRLITTHKANANADYKAMLFKSRAANITYSHLFTSVHEKYLKGEYG
jgi:nitronate monooxygenase